MTYGLIKNEDWYNKIEEGLIVFLFGALLYTLMEIAYRGHSHWTMSVTGGICCLSLYWVYCRMPELKWWKKCLLGSLIITFWEFSVGCVVNLALAWNVWDYSLDRFNVLGQICLLFSVAWFFLSIPVVILAKFLHNNYFKHEYEQNAAVSKDLR